MDFIFRYRMDELMPLFDWFYEYDVKLYAKDVCGECAVDNARGDMKLAVGFKLEDEIAPLFVIRFGGGV